MNRRSRKLALAISIALGTSMAGLQADTDNIILDPPAGEHVEITGLPATPDFDRVLCYSSGATGSVGELGNCASDALPVGPTGATGAMGATGAQGPSGPQGVQGKIGPQGPIGDTGPAGATGADGMKGDTGADGATGMQGDPGATGPTGPGGQVIHGGIRNNSSRYGPFAWASVFRDHGEETTGYGPGDAVAFPASGSITDFYFKLETGESHGAASSADVGYYIAVNGSTASFELGCHVIEGTNTSCMDTSGCRSVTAGDFVHVVADSDGPGATAPAPADGNWHALFTPGGSCPP